MIVFQIYVDSIAFHPSECDPPVSAGVDRIAAFVAADERMKTEARQVHVLWPRCVIKRAKDVRDPPRILHAEPPSIARPEEPFQGLVSERSDDNRSCRPTPYNCREMPYIRFRDATSGLGDAFTCARAPCFQAIRPQVKAQNRRASAFMAYSEVLARSDPKPRLVVALAMPTECPASREQACSSCARGAAGRAPTPPRWRSRPASSAAARRRTPGSPARSPAPARYR